MMSRSSTLAAAKPKSSSSGSSELDLRSGIRSENGDCPRCNLVIESSSRVLPSCMETILHSSGNLSRKPGSIEGASTEVSWLVVLSLYTDCGQQLIVDLFDRV